LIVNETEAQALLALPAPLAGDAAQCARRVQTQLPALWAAWPALQQLVVTLGAQGCLAWTRVAPMKAPVAVQADVHVEVAAVAPAVLAPAAVTPTVAPPTLPTPTLAPPSLAPAATACWYAPAHTITAADTVGAGDAFASGYCAALMAGHAVPTALLWGNACGAQVASSVGVLDALPGAATLQQWLAQADAPQVVLMALL
jgi:sugar/nucleoside kinase (ribokinase family)